MKPGETREVTMLYPGLVVQPARAILRARQLEDVPVLQGEQNLLKIDQTIEIGQQPVEMTIEMTLWTDLQGAILKSSIAGMGQVTYRTTQEKAIAQSTHTGFDLGRDSVVHVTTPLPRPHDTRRVVYEATLPNKNPRQVFASCSSQQIHPVSDRTVRIDVLALRPGDPKSVAHETPPSKTSLAANDLIQSDDAIVRQLAQRAAGNQKDPWSIAVTLERFVFEQIQAKGFTIGLATAAHVARNLAGDCTEHAVLLAALCRAREIPARIAIGLVYSSVDQGFAFHMWNEAWIQDRWVPLDATLGKGGIGAAHLKLNDSDLSLEQAQTAILYVLQVMNQLELKIVEIQY